MGKNLTEREKFLKNPKRYLFKLKQDRLRRIEDEQIHLENQIMDAHLYFEEQLNEIETAHRVGLYNIQAWAKEADIEIPELAEAEKPRNIEESLERALRENDAIAYLHFYNLLHGEAGKSDVLS